MIALDTNILVYAHRRDSSWHASAATCVRKLAQGSDAWAIPWPCLSEFLSTVTHERIFSPPTTVERALAQVSAWLESPLLVFLGEGAGYSDVLQRTLTRAQVTGSRLYDARVAAVCIHHGVRELWTADRDFGRFPELTVRNPLLRQPGGDSRGARLRRAH